MICVVDLVPENVISASIVKVGGIFSIGQNAVAVVTGVVDPLGVGRFDVFDVALPS